MIIFKTIDEFSREDGKKIGSRKIFDFFICDFTGEKIDQNTNPNTYNIDYRSSDPCFGDGKGEEWYYKWSKDNENNFLHNELFGQGNYIFITDYYGAEVFEDLIKKALNECKDGIYSLDHLLRWSRGKMLEKVLKEGTYKIEQFLEE